MNIINFLILLIFIPALSNANYDGWPCKFKSIEEDRECIINKNGNSLEELKNTGECALVGYNDRKVETTFLGKLNDKEIYEILNTSPQGGVVAFSQQIVIETDGGKYKPVLCVIFGTNTVFIGKSFIIPEHSIIAYRAKIDGTASDILKYTLYYPPSSKFPKFIELEKEAFSMLQHIIPKDYLFNSNTPLDYKTWKLTSHIAKPNDPNCCATAGRIEAQFDFTKEGELKLESYNYNPN